MGTGQGQLRHLGRSHGTRTWPNGATAPEGKTADSGPRERPPGHRSGPMGTARTQGTHGVGRQRPGPFGSGQAPPRADHRPPRRLRWPISPTGFLAPTFALGRSLRLAASRSWGFWVGETVARRPRYGVANSEAPTPAGGQTQPSAPWTPGVPGPAGRNGPSEAPRRPMVGPGRCQAAPTGPSRSPPALQVPGATSRPLRAPHDRPGGHMRPDLAAGPWSGPSQRGRRSAMYVYHTTPPPAWRVSSRPLSPRGSSWVTGVGLGRLV